MKKRLLAMLLAMLMVMGTLPMAAFADGSADSATVSQVPAKGGTAATKTGTGDVTAKAVLANYNLGLSKAPWDSASLTINSVTAATQDAYKTVDITLAVSGLKACPNAGGTYGKWIGVGVPFVTQGDEEPGGYANGSAFYWGLGAAPTKGSYESKPVGDDFIAGGWSSSQCVEVDGTTYIGRYWDLSKLTDAHQNKAFIIVRDPKTDGGNLTWEYTVYNITFNITNTDPTVSVSPAATDTTNTDGVKVYTASGTLGLVVSGTDGTQGNNAYKFGYYPSISLNPGSADYVIVSRGQNPKAFSNDDLKALLNTAEAGKKFPYTNDYQDGLNDWFQVYATTGNDAAAQGDAIGHDWLKDNATYNPNVANAPKVNIVLAKKTNTEDGYTYDKYQFDFSACTLGTPFEVTVPTSPVLGKQVSAIQGDLTITNPDSATFVGKTITVSGTCNWVDSWPEAGFPTNTGSYVALKIEPKTGMPIKEIKVQMSDTSWKTLDPADHTLVWQLKDNNKNVKLQAVFGGEEKNDSILEYTLDLTGVTPAIKPTSPAVLTTGVDTAILNGGNDSDHKGSSNATTYTASFGTGDDAKKITLTAEGLGKTTWGTPDHSGGTTSGTNTYVVGVALPKQDNVVYAWGFGESVPADAEYKTVSRFQGTGNSHVTFYFMKDDQAAWTANNKGYISVKNAAGGDPVIYPIIFDVTVEGSEPTVPTIVEAPLADHPYADKGRPNEDVVTTGLGTIDVGAVTAVTGDDGEVVANTYKFTVTGTDIVKHRNAAGTVGYWVGFGMPIDNADGAGYSYQVDGEDVGSVSGRVINVGGKNYNTIYFDEAGDYTIVQTKTVGQTTTTVTYKVHVVINRVADPTPGTAYGENALEPANLTGWIASPYNPAGSNASRYTVDYNATDKKITITAAQLAKHANSADVQAYWVGLALPKAAGTTYAKGFGALPDLTPGLYGDLTTTQTVNGQEYVTTYWGWSNPAGVASTTTGWLSVKDADGKVVNYAVEFDISVKTVDLPADFKVVEAPIADHPAQGETEKTDLGTVAVSGLISTGENVYSLTLTGTDIVEHRNANGKLGTWVGFGMPVDGTSTYSYTLKGVGGAEDTTLTSVPGRVITDDDDNKYNTVYFDEAGTYTIVQTKTVDDVETTVTYYVNVVIKVDKSALDAAIKAANDAKEDVVTDTDANNVAVGTKWVTAAEMQALTDAIAGAQAVMANDEATAADVKAAVDALNGAKSTFENARKDGTKTGSTTVPPSGNLGGGGGGTAATTTTTTTNPDGSKTTTVTDNKTGTITATTEKPDGTTEVVETKKDGTVTETTTDKDGAKVEKVTTPEKDVAITVTDKDGEVLAEVKLPAEIPALDESKKFVDVPDDNWAAEAINNMAALGVVQGKGNQIFDRKAPMKRSELAEVLYKMSNGKSGIASSFTDVTAGKWYANSVAWAASVGVVKGVGENSFAPDRTITREELAVMLCRYAKLLGMDTAADNTALNGFKDGDRTHSWAQEGMAWCVNKGILQGKGNGVLDPRTNVTRAEVAVMLQRFMDLMK